MFEKSLPVNLQTDGTPFIGTEILCLRHLGQSKVIETCQVGLSSKMFIVNG